MDEGTYQVERATLVHLCLYWSRDDIKLLQIIDIGVMENQVKLQQTAGCQERIEAH